MLVALVAPALHGRVLCRWLSGEIEESPISKGLIQSLREKSISTRGIKPTTDKRSRLISQQDLFAAGSITFEAGAEWLPELTSELLAFPGGKNDDQVDAI